MYPSKFLISSVIISEVPKSINFIRGYRSFQLSINLGKRDIDIEYLDDNEELQSKHIFLNEKYSLLQFPKQVIPSEEKKYALLFKEIYYKNISINKLTLVIYGTDKENFKYQVQDFEFEIYLTFDNICVINLKIPNQELLKLEQELGSPIFFN